MGRTRAWGNFVAKRSRKKGRSWSRKPGWEERLFTPQESRAPDSPAHPQRGVRSRAFTRLRSNSRRPTSLTNGHPRTDAARPPARDSLAQMQGLLANPRLPPASPALPN